MKTIFFILMISFFSFRSFALPLPSPGSVSMATGGSGRGVVEPVDSVLLNPAVVSLLTSKFFSANYTNQQWGLVVADNGREALFPAALAFVRSDVNDFKIQQLSLDLAYAYKNVISVGLTASMYEYNDDVNRLDQKYRQTTADVGIAYAPTQNFSMGFVANKMAASKLDDLDESYQKQRTIAVGVQYTYANFVRFRFDTESGAANETRRLIYMGGLETYLNDWLIFRLGYQNNNVVAKNYSSIGLGFAGPQFQLHYAYKTNVADNHEAQHSIDLGIPF